MLSVYPGAWIGEVAASGGRLSTAAVETVTQHSERVWCSTAATRLVVLVLHGGAETGLRPVRPWRLAYLRMVLLSWRCRQGCRSDGVELRLLRNRVRGWNAPYEDPVVDARAALRRIHRERPGVPIAVVGHSMGGRVALRIADDAAVVAVCALAPWAPPELPSTPVTGRAVLIGHGTLDVTTSPSASYCYASRAGSCASCVTRVEVSRSGHAMVRRMRVWHRLVTEFILRTAGARSCANENCSAVRDGGGRLRLRV